MQLKKKNDKYAGQSKTMAVKQAIRDRIAKGVKPGQVASVGLPTAVKQAAASANPAPGAKQPTTPLSASQPLSGAKPIHPQSPFAASVALARKKRALKVMKQGGKVS